MWYVFFLLRFYGNIPAWKFALAAAATIMLIRANLTGTAGPLVPELIFASATLATQTPG